MREVLKLGPLMALLIAIPSSSRGAPRLAGAASRPAAAAAGAPEDSDCLKCHSPIEAALRKKVVHAAAQMGCETCHIDHRQPAKPGAKKIEHYLTAAAPELCLTCHDAQDAKLAAAHHGQPFQTANCARCHDPHASSQAKLLYEVAHPPFAERGCESCHDKPQSGKIHFVAASVNETCFICHADLQDRLSKAKSRHSLLESGSCTDCHDPHVSRYQVHLKQAPEKLCTTCHSVTEGKKFVHEPVRTSCTLCHDPHATDFPQHLRAGGNDLCLECHGADAGARLKADGAIALFNGTLKLPGMPFPQVILLPLKAGERTGHPLPTHPVLVSAEKGNKELNCLSCHKPHAANGSPRLLVTEKPATSGLCLQCHK